MFIRTGSEFIFSALGIDSVEGDIETNSITEL